MYDFFVQASSLHTNEQAGAKKSYFGRANIQINRASILELSVHCKCPVLSAAGITHGFYVIGMDFTYGNLDEGRIQLERR
jgi:hypothetical protein